MSRRDYGTGTVTQQPDGSWRGRVDFGRGLDGRRIRRSVRGRTERDVERKIGALLEQRRGGAGAAAGRLTVGAFLVRWLDSAPPNLRPRTLAGYRSIVDRHLLPTLGGIPLERLNGTHVQQVLNRLARGEPGAEPPLAPAAPNTVRNVKNVLHRALRQAVRGRQLGHNPASDVDLPQARRYEVAALSVEGAAAVMDAMRGDRLEPLVVLALATGLRQGELLALRWSDVDFADRHLTVRHTLQRHAGRTFLAPPKTRSGRRTVPLPGFAVAALRRQEEWFQANDRRFAGERWQEAGYVFTTSIGTPLHGGDVTRHLQRRLAAAGLPRMRFHDLRHAAATLMLAQGAQARELMATLGHSTITVTLDIYAHVLPASQRATADRLDAAFGGHFADGTGRDREDDGERGAGGGT